MVRASRSMDTIRSISLKYSRFMPRDGSRPLGGDKLVDARAQVLEDEILLGGGAAFVDLLRPLFQRHLDPEGFVDCERDVEKIEAVDPQVVDRVTFGFDLFPRDVAGLRNNVYDSIERRRHR